MSGLPLHSLRQLERALAGHRDTLAGGGGDDLDERRERAGRRRLGAYFTPLPLVRFVVHQTLAAYAARVPLRWRSSGAPALRILDPAAGDGRFLCACAAALADMAAARGLCREKSHRAIVRECLLGFERDPHFAEAARNTLGSASVIHECEALLDAPDGTGGLDIVVGNPPYQRSIHLARSDPHLWRRLKGRYEATSHGEWDLYGAFLEQAYDWLGPDGQLGFVVPSRWLTADFARRLRQKLADERAMRALVDFGASQLFVGATTYSSVVFLSQAKVSKVSVARLRDHTWHSGNIRSSELGAAPWRLSVGPRRRMFADLSAAPTLGAVAQIAKGAGTNADRVYVFAAAETQGKLLLVPTLPELSGADTALVEPDLVRDCIRGRDVKAFATAAPLPKILVPYTRDGRLLSGDELSCRFPHAYAYLRRCRAVLDKREAGRFAGDQFYRFGRPQNMAYHGSPSAKLVIPDVARSGRAMIDRRGSMVLDSAYSLRVRRVSGEPSSYTLAILMAILSSPMVSLWLEETGTFLRGNYVRMKTAYLAGMPLPKEGPALGRVERLASAPKVDRQALSEAVRVAYGGIDAQLWHR